MEQQQPPILQVVPVDDSELKYRDINKQLEDILGGGQSVSLEAMVEKHQRRISAEQRQVLLYLLTSRFYSHRRYAEVWLEMASQEGNASDFIELQRARTLEIPESQRSLSFMPGGQ